MDKIMAILVEEADYARELASFLSAREEFLYKPVTFTDVSAYLRFEQENNVDLLLCDRSLEPGERPESPGKVCILTEYSTVGEDNGERSSVFKYQSSEKLLQDNIDTAESYLEDFNRRVTGLVNDVNRTVMEYSDRAVKANAVKVLVPATSNSPKLTDGGWVKYIIIAEGLLFVCYIAAAVALKCDPPNL